MKRTNKITAFLTLMIIMALPLQAMAVELEEYMSSFTYEARKEMKINSKELVKLLKENKAQLIDIRFKEEFAAWSMGFAENIPLNELPSRLSELDKNKIIVTACPHKDRAAIARLYLATKGYKTKYLTDGLLGVAELLRGDRARDFIHAIQK